MQSLNRPLRIHPLLRVAMALIVLGGGAAFILGGLAWMVVAPDRPLPHPTGAGLLGFATVAAGFAFLYVGARVMRARTPRSSVLGPRARRACGIAFVGVAVVEALSALLIGSVAFVVGAALSASMAFWMLRSVRPAGRAPTPVAAPPRPAGPGDAP